MERMGDILARTATRRASQRGTGAGAAKRLSQARQMSGANTVNTINSANGVSGVRTAATARRTSGTSAANATNPGSAASVGSSVPSRLANIRHVRPEAADVAPAGAQPQPQPANIKPADSLTGPAGVDSDQILELPARQHTKPAPVTPLPRRRTLAARGSAAQPEEPPIPAAMTPLRDLAQGFLARRAAAPAAAPVDSENEQATRQPTPKKRASRAKQPDVCPLCGGAGYVRLDVPVGDPAFGKPVPCQCREREWEERRRLDLRRFSSLDPFYDKTFATFDQKAPGVREAYEVARRYAEDPEGWLVLRGGYGCGKTHLAAAIANAHLAAGAHVFFSIVPDLLDHLRAAFAPNSELRYDEMFDKIREAGLLVLDDLGAENGTAWATEKLFQIINYRYNFRMPTVITTNSRLLSHMDERIASRLSDIALVHTIVIEAPDYRKRHTNGAPRAGQNGSGGQRGRGQAR